MIIKKLAKLVKKSHNLGITFTFNEQEKQWLGGSWGLYDISDLPTMTFAQACAMFDFSAKTIDKIWNDDDGAKELADKAQAACRFKRYELDEIEIHSTFFGDEEMKVIVDKDQTTFAFILAELLSPIVETEYTYKALVQGEDGATYLLVADLNDSVTSYPERNGGELAGVADKDIQLHEPLSKRLDSRGRKQSGKQFRGGAPVHIR